MAVDLERLNWLLQAVILEFDPEPLTDEERGAYEEIKTEVAEDPDAVWSPLPD
jgi:hypothetical protein